MKAPRSSATELSRRQLEVLRLVASGRTNREVAELLRLSQRTVDMHIRNVLSKFDCRNRTEATARAHALGLVPDGHPTPKQSSNASINR